MSNRNADQIVILLPVYTDKICDKRVQKIASALAQFITMHGYYVRIEPPHVDFFPDEDSASQQIDVITIVAEPDKQQPRWIDDEIIRRVLFLKQRFDSVAVQLFIRGQRIV